MNAFQWSIQTPTLLFKNPFFVFSVHSKNKNNTANDHYSDSDIRQPIYSLLILLYSFEFLQVHNFFFREIIETRIKRHKKTYDENNDAGFFQNCDPPLMAYVIGAWFRKTFRF